MSRRNKQLNTTEAQTTDAAPILTTDSFSNPLFRLGFGAQAPLEATNYPLTNLTDQYAKLDSMYRSGGIVQSIIDIVPADMLREWVKLGGDFKAENQDTFEKAVIKTKTRARIEEGFKWGRLYGGAVGLILIKGQENDLERPLNLKSVLPESYAGLWILDRWSGVFPDTLQLVTDVTDPDFGLPEYYDIRSEETKKPVARVHHSRLVRFTGRELPYLEKLRSMYWGESEIEPLYDDIVLYDSVMHNMGNLTFQANVDTLAIKNLEQLLSIGSVEQQRRFWSVMQAQSVMKSNFGVRLIDQETQVHNQQYTFTGYNYVVDAVQSNLAAKTHIPVTKLFGQSPGGLNATGESDMQNYYDFIDGLREGQLRPVLEKLIPVICMSAWGEVPEDLTINFPPLWTPTAAELANIAAAKSTAVINAFQSNLVDRGAAQAELKKLAEETGMFDSIEDTDIESNKGTYYQDMQQMQDPMAGLFGNMPEGGGGPDEDKSEPKQTADGGPGSGNFGHAGRPGEVGGSAPAEGSSWKSKTPRVEAPEHIQKLATQQLDRAHAAEPPVTKTLKHFADQTGGEMYGLDFRFKGQKSMARKIRDKSASKGITPEEYAPRVHDALRYTVAYNNENFVSGFEKFAQSLRKKGYNIIEVENYMKYKDVPYRGVNTLVRSPKGYVFELQFHTPQSFDIKERRIHKAYEVLRDPGESHARREAAQRYCVKYSNTLDAPKDIAKIEDYWE